MIEGEGNVSFVCPSCGFVIAKNVWKLSLLNVVTKCPSCQTFSEFASKESMEIKVKSGIFGKPRSKSNNPFIFINNMNVRIETYWIWVNKVAKLVIIFADTIMSFIQFVDHR